MKLDRQDYKDTDKTTARAAGCDVCQLKYDGWWSRIEIKNGFIDFYSRTGRKYDSVCFSDTDLVCSIVGEHMRGTQWSQDPQREGRVYLFDTWMYGLQTMYTQPYTLRYRLTKLLASRLPSTFSVVDNFQMGEADSLWEGQVKNGIYEGLVYRRSSDPVDAVLYREKNTIVVRLRAVEFIEGQGKHVGRLGAIRGVTEDGVTVDVGGGYTDRERDEIWYLRDRLVGSIFEVEARARFESGSLRHPNFVRWITAGS